MSLQRKAACNSFPRVLLFPEGTTTNGRFLISFQHGAFIPGYPVQPVVVRYPHVHFDQSWWAFSMDTLFDRHSSFCCLNIFILYLILCFRGNISLLKLMFKMFTQFHNFMEVCMACWICPSKCLNCHHVLLAPAPYTISSSDGSSNMQVEYLPVVYPPEIKQENALHFAENVNIFISNIFVIRHPVHFKFQ